MIESNVPDVDSGLALNRILGLLRVLEVVALWGDQNMQARRQAAHTAAGQPVSQLPADRRRRAGLPAVTVAGEPADRPPAAIAFGTLALAEIRLPETIHRVQRIRGRRPGNRSGTAGIRTRRDRPGGPSVQPRPHGRGGRCAAASASRGDRPAAVCCGADRRRAGTGRAAGPAAAAETGESRVGVGQVCAGPAVHTESRPFRRGRARPHVRDRSRNTAGAALRAGCVFSGSLPAPPDDREGRQDFGR